MNYFRKVSAFVLMNFFFFVPLSAEVVGNLEFTPPITLTDWNKTEYNDIQDKIPLKAFVLHYEHKTEELVEFFCVTNFKSIYYSCFEINYSDEAGVKKYLINKCQKLAAQICAEEANYSDLQAKVTDIVAKPNSIYYKLTFDHKGKITHCFWCREVKQKDQLIDFFYMLGEKCPNDPNFSIKDLEGIASPWIEFLRDDFCNKVILNE